MIQRELQNPLATMILDGRVKDGDTVRVGVGPKGLTLTPGTGPAEESKPARGRKTA